MFADILINHAYSRKQERFTYKIPNDIKIEIGSGVVVPFQRGKQAGLVLNVHKERPEFKTRDICELLDPNILLRKWQLELTEWIAEYYFCTNYDAIRPMLPKHIWRVPKQNRSTKQAKEKVWKETPAHKLSKDQEKIVTQILNENIKESLIHGITGSGKTEIYKHLIQSKVKGGKQALLLVPEISLTPQLVKYFEGSFKHIAVTHSRISEGKRAQQWKDIHSGKTSLVIGSRSALFSPFKNLGIIIMDEEHEWTYKQDQSPRYHARKLAKKMAELTNAQLILGSATPSIESMWELSVQKVA